MAPRFASHETRILLDKRLFKRIDNLRRASARTVGYRWLPNLAVFSSLASSNSSQKQHFYARHHPRRVAVRPGLSPLTTR